MYTIDLEEFIIKNNLTQQELADILGVSQPYINNVVKGKSKLSSKKILELLQTGKYDSKANTLFYFIKGTELPYIK